ncbi:hypothetical protein PoB_002053500 [Plakobranchus ocellatus]|uniref:Uncharacterized protein n=1 Tax=Plakobranchus ocellatus TaxID=259542 RepID=A0AAV3ZHG9_9GAST|nr:hypothetical protein PoB_002053500 [Plakobranchus ocellatus]
MVAIHYCRHRRSSDTLGGHGHNRLTAETIRKQYIYYTRAIRRGRSAEETRRGILAGLYRVYSMDNHPQHQLCPPGPDSWCFFRSPLASNTTQMGTSSASTLCWIYTAPSSTSGAHLQQTLIMDLFEEV